jgi:hypothetical protein
MPEQRAVGFAPAVAMHYLKQADSALVEFSQ